MAAKIILSRNGTLHSALTDNQGYHLLARYPITLGLCFTIFTWMIIYLDSREPGVNPPSPLSPKKIRYYSGHTFHLNYLMALLLGASISIIVYYDI